MQVNNEMVVLAVKKAVSLGVFPTRFETSEQYDEAWNHMKKILEAALTDYED